MKAGNLRVLRIIFLVLIFTLLSSFAYGKLIFVDDDATGLNDGSSWENAYVYLQDALADANSAEKPIEIRVAQGTYKPDQGANVPYPPTWPANLDYRATFNLVNGVTIKGGYAGFAEPDPNFIDIELYKTILSGDIDGDDIYVSDPCDLFEEPTRRGNSQNVVTSRNTNATAVLDGVAITGGYIWVFTLNRPGGGPVGGAGMMIYSGSPSLINCTFTGNATGNAGGGLLLYDNSNPMLLNCKFIGNYAAEGGGLWSSNSNPILYDCIFENNYARSKGGGMSNRVSNPELTNCLFSHNLTSGRGSTTEGGGIYNRNSNPILTNCTFSNNAASRGGAIYNKDSNNSLNICEFVRNTCSTYGGAICSDGGQQTIKGCVFEDNFSGAVRDYSTVGTTFDNCTFRGNSSEGDNGAAAYVNKASFNHCLFAGNAALGYYWDDIWSPSLGGAVFNMNTTLFNNCTFIKNWAEYGDAIYSLAMGEVYVNNSIFCGSENQIYVEPYWPTFVRYSNVQGGWDGEGNIDVDPLFVEPGYWVHIEDANVVVEPNDPNAVWVDGDYHLKSQAGRWDSASESWVVDEVTSPCIDAGDLNSPVGDEPEPNGGRINMGAYGGTAEASKSGSTWWFATTGGPIVAEGLGVILPHEHIFTDLRGPGTRGYGQADTADVVRVMSPFLEEAKQKGVGLLFECSSIGVGRNASILSEVSAASGLPVVVPTGVYGRANFAPPEHKNMSEDELTALFISEIRDGIEGTGIKAGFIKIATGGGNMTALEEKFLRAAGRAARETGAAVASHTTVSGNVTRQADILESISPEVRFIWVHAQSVNNRSLYRQLAERGIFIEFDSLGWNPGQDSTFIAAIKELLAGSFGEQILLSHDAGWYQPGEQNGGTQMPYTYLIDTFIPKLRDSGVDDEAIRMITEENPIRAFGFNQDVKP